MKVITLKQPWATLIAIGAKKIETRSWRTNYHGDLGIHASRKYDPADMLLACTSPFAQTLKSAGYDPKALPTGAIIAECILYDVKSTTDKGLVVDDLESCFGDYSPGRFAWLLTGVCKFVSPIPYKGALGLWDWPVFAAEQPHATDAESTRG